MTSVKMDEGEMITSGCTCSGGSRAAVAVGETGGDSAALADGETGGDRSILWEKGISSAPRASLPPPPPSGTAAGAAGAT